MDAAEAASYRQHSQNSQKRVGREAGSFLCYNALMKKLIFFTGFLALFSVYQVPVMRASELGCNPGEVSACCQSWQTEFTTIDEEYLGWWDQALNKAMDTSDLVGHGITTLRSYYCDLRAVCENVRWSYQNEAPEQSSHLFMVGCFTEEDQKEREVIEECRFQEGGLSQAMYDDLVGACFQKARLKFDEEKAFFKTVWWRDAVHKKTAILVARLSEFLSRVRDDFLTNVEEMTTGFDKLFHKIGCTIAQCD